MVSWKAEAQVGYKTGFCLSGDDKPTTGVANGSSLIEMDTGTEYRYDAEGGEWYAQGSGGGGGGGLPAVTSEDNGDVLTVVNGQWDKAAPSGGGSDIFVVTYTDNSGTLTYDKHFAEIYAAYKAGAMVFGKLSPGSFILAGIDFDGPDEPTCIHFISLNTNGTTVTICHIYHYPATGSDPEEAIFTLTDVTGTVGA